LIRLLAEPPAVTWALQIAVLDAIADLGLHLQDVGHLAAVDNLYVQAAVGRVESEGVNDQSERIPGAD
jgi:hypothetical protein